jgi:DNA-binding PadR family transcriptional regulator
LELKPIVPRRVLKATIDLAILKVLASQAMTGYGLLGYFPKKTGITVANTIVYNSLTSMERKGWIRCVSNRKGRVYSPTEKGKEIVAKLPAISEEIQRYTRLLLG